MPQNREPVRAIKLARLPSRDVRKGTPPGPCTTGMRVGTMKPAGGFQCLTLDAKDLNAPASWRVFPAEMCEKTHRRGPCKRA